MTKPKPWSHSALEAFKNCPRQYHAVRVIKSVVETEGPQATWGKEVHKHFEDRLANGVVLPAALEMHEEFLARLEALPGQQFVEQQIALNTNGQPCEYFADDVWFRGVIDYLKIDGDHARVIDYKTGKQHQKLQQLFLFTLYVFAAYPQVQSVRAEFYWTQSRSLVGVTCTRENIDGLWAVFIPDLKQFAQAFREDIWQPRQSGLCRRHCPVTDCEFNGLGLRR